MVSMWNFNTQTIIKHVEINNGLMAEEDKYVRSIILSLLLYGSATIEIRLGIFT